MSFILSADPGQTGGLVLIESLQGDKYLQIVKVMMMPMTEAKSKNRVDVEKIFDFVADIPIGYCILENVHSMPRQGVASAFQFGRSFGSLEGAMAEISPGPIKYLEPGVWKGKMGLSGKDKEQARMRASRLFGPNSMEVYWPLKKHEGIAEAALMTYHWQTNVVGIT